MAVGTKASADTFSTAVSAARKRDVYEGGRPSKAPDPTTIVADYKAMVDALALVKADGAYAGLAAPTKAAVDALAPFA